MPFVKGQSGNPAGRTNIPGEIAEIFEALLSAFPNPTPAEQVALRSLAKLQWRQDHTGDILIARDLAGEVRRGLQMLHRRRQQTSRSLPPSRAFDEALKRKAAAHVG
jgi:predicted membrane GTPase involved in stress response